MQFAIGEFSYPVTIQRTALGDVEYRTVEYRLQGSSSVLVLCLVSSCWVMAGRGLSRICHRGSNSYVYTVPVQYVRERQERQETGETGENREEAASACHIEQKDTRARNRKTILQGS